ncbi:ABA4-like family protein [Actinokineospora globicatena]|uniref:DUF4281 domain-containing protein n=1 Tax=Actinokineospora globicatena TaxID=103729 RepID=A0A9W6QVQ1_9PSEU|nr:ABA4-like family protein [Actinokineospora globicatena]MCP2302032.1 protein of unknown function (DUF4281) [Actinokineospora globicatena]GLW76306.1 hypothetical protein Aglo01_07880 [Actinokineospora globicatena]GLW83142.1 hypothetical protein Aglo02_07820 [Actinokineospora globicatena]GLW95422.1 hypothetical protein Aglo03_62380 [Actinokineospora globicatena]
MSTLFDLAFYAVAPFWALMIIVPTWSWTRRIAGSPWIVLPGLVVWAVAAVPVFGDLVTGVTQPTLAFWLDFLRDDNAVVAVWAQVLAWDLFLGRWIYLDSRARGINPLLMAPIMVLTILLSPIGLPLYLLVRLGFPARDEQVRVGSGG